jgi:hypothetical protein
MLTTSYPLVCNCGHKGSIHLQENVQPHSLPWEKYSLIDFNGGTLSRNGPITLSEVFALLRPTCPACGTVADQDDLTTY